MLVVVPQRMLARPFPGFRVWPRPTRSVCELSRSDQGAARLSPAVRESLDRQRGPGILRSLAALIRDAEKGNCRPLRSRLEAGSGEYRQDSTEGRPDPCSKARGGRKQRVGTRSSRREIFGVETQGRGVTRQRKNAAVLVMSGSHSQHRTAQIGEIVPARFGEPRKARLSASLAVGPSRFWHVAS
jgi:hypothetical protein